MNPAPTKVPILKGLQNAMNDAWQKWFKELTGTATTSKATATQYAKLRTYSFPSTNNVSAKATLLLTPTGDSAHYQPIMIEVIAKQGTSGLDTTNAQINVLHNSEEAVQADSFDLITATAANGNDIELWMQSDVASKYAVQVISEELDTGVTSAYNDGATWTATNPVTGAAASVTSGWAGEVSYTPTITIGGSSTGITYSTQVGRRVKSNGFTVDFGRIMLSSKGGLTGAILIQVGGTNNSAFANVTGTIALANTAAGVTDNHCVLVGNALASNNFNIYVGTGTAMTTLGGGSITDTFAFDYFICYQE